ncbi:predicted protein [Nematostella vectensis]|uniref:Alpha-1,3-mannosyl-glycoprotein 2-beta-N-acetylglucosaminyltransferase n=2 Tax=Nematostella vectensis TaxID=45351 RepID=A7RRS3_NEMVE|nr:predicted protein [Nematostella vectensis]|eukprot:XP_001637936.1 predicted protein [Nematostella vectensis]
MASRGFDTYASKQDSDLLVELIEDVSEGRIICFAVKDEASLTLKRMARNMMKSLGSFYIGSLRWRDTWAFVTQKTGHGGRALAEGFQKCPKSQDSWASPVLLRTTFTAETTDNTRCDWEDSEASRRRREFCDKYEGYKGVCKCVEPSIIDMDPPTLEGGGRVKLPIAVMASRRPHYLFRMLKTLHGVVGLDPSMVTVFIDGFYDEPASIAKLFNLRVDAHAPISKLNSRIAQHYKKSLTTSFARFPDAQYLVILEEDLDISVDILTYFQQMLPILETDESLFCISAWNDQGYEHSSHDPSMMYRLETMPGLGWVLSRKIYKGELEAKWPKPDVFWDWDMWTRSPDQLKGRECIIPDVSRTYHFGAKGLNMNPYFQDAYFTKHAFNRQPNVKFNAEIMRKDNYEKEIHRLITSATLLDHDTTPCANPKSFVPDTKEKTYVFYIAMKQHGDWKTWNNVARCFRMWDLDVRGFHKSMFRFWIKENHIIVVGCPSSPYCVHKPANISPISMLKTEKRPADD